jgi:hypothetical protein
MRQYVAIEKKKSTNDFFCVAWGLPHRSGGLKPTLRLTCNFAKLISERFTEERRWLIGLADASLTGDAQDENFR